MVLSPPLDFPSTCIVMVLIVHGLFNLHLGNGLNFNLSALMLDILFLAACKFWFWIARYIFYLRFANYSYDSLTLYDGDSNAVAMVGKYCGQVNPPNFISSSNTAFIHFQSDAMKLHLIEYSGFKLEYHAYNRHPSKYLKHCFSSERIHKLSILPTNLKRLQ